jgi:hypothetical protein
MKRSLPVIVLIIALAVPALGASAAPGEPAHAAAKPKNCTTPFTRGRIARVVQVTNVSCKAGRKVAGRVVRSAPSGCVKVVDEHHVTLVKPCTQLGYRCTGRSIANGVIVGVRCRRDARVVTFQY